MEERELNLIMLEKRCLAGRIFLRAVSEDVEESVKSKGCELTYLENVSLSKVSDEPLGVQQYL